MTHVIKSKLDVLGADYYWSRGHDGFVADRKKATEFPTHEDAYVELVDEGFEDIAEVRTEA